MSTVKHLFYRDILSTWKESQHVKAFEDALDLKIEYTYSDSFQDKKEWVDPNSDYNTIPGWLCKALSNPNEKTRSPVPCKVVTDLEEYKVKYPIHVGSFTSKAIKKQGVLYFDLHMTLEVTKIYLNLSDINVIPHEMEISVYGRKLYTVFPKKTFDKNVYAFEIPATNFSKIDGSAKCKLKYTRNSWLNDDGYCLLEYAYQANNVLECFKGQKGLNFSC